MEGSDPSQDELEVQDNAREVVMAALCGLVHVRGRQGEDARDRSGNKYELKSTTQDAVGTARDFGPHTITLWRDRYVIAGFGKNRRSGFEFSDIFVFHPDDLAERFASLAAEFAAAEEKTLRRVALMERGGGTYEDSAGLIEDMHKAMLKNNPKIGLPYCRKHGTPLLRPYPDNLLRFVAARPIVRDAAAQRDAEEFAAPFQRLVRSIGGSPRRRSVSATITIPTMRSDQ